VLPGPPQTPDAQLQQVQRKSGRQHPVFYRQQMWRGTRAKNTINTYLAIPNFTSLKQDAPDGVFFKRDLPARPLAPAISL
jgi:hypothetical protein